MAARPARPPPNAKAGRPAPKPKTRAGRPVGDKDLLTITWTKRMEFTGRTKDPTGRPAGRADFYGIVNAKMTDAQLHCEQKMIVFTDREVPLARSAPRRRPVARTAPWSREVKPRTAMRSWRRPAARSEADLSLIYCFGNPVAISRKVDPELPDRAGEAADRRLAGEGPVLQRTPGLQPPHR